MNSGLNRVLQGVLRLQSDGTYTCTVVQLLMYIQIRKSQKNIRHLSLFFQALTAHFIP